MQAVQGLVYARLVAERWRLWLKERRANLRYRLAIMDTRLDGIGHWLAVGAVIDGNIDDRARIFTNAANAITGRRLDFLYPAQGFFELAVFFAYFRATLARLATDGVPDAS